MRTSITAARGTPRIVKGALSLQLGRADEARGAFGRAIALAGSSAEAAHVRMHLDRLSESGAPTGGRGR